MKLGGAVIFVRCFAMPEAHRCWASAITVAAEVLLSRRGRGLSGNNRRCGVSNSKIAGREMADKTHDDIKQKMILAGKVLVAEGQDDFTRGHISVRVPSDPKLFFMKAHSLGLDEITMANILTIDLEGNVVAGSARRHSEVYIHSEIFKVRADVNCVIHTHPPYSVALSASGRPLRCYSQPAALFYDALGVYVDTINLIRTQAMGAGVAKALGQNRAILLKNHGVVVTGGDIEEAVVGTIMLENAAMVQMTVEAAGEAGADFPRADLEKLKHDISQPEQFKINFDYLVRRLKRQAKSGDLLFP
jgi:L-fuculose-phosphate aldolase